MGHRIRSVSVHDAGASAAEGLKRQTFKQLLSGVDLLVGANGAGKTTRGPLGITAALEGLATVPTDPRRPYVGTLPEATAVTLEIETPGGVRTLTRELFATKGNAAAEANQRARDLVGIPPTAWDLRDFASGTDGDRGKILDAVARAGGALERWDAPRAQEHTRGLLLAGAEEKDHDPEAWTGPLNECVEALDTAPDGATWLRAAEVWAVETQKRTNLAQKQADGNLSSLTKTAPAAPEGDAQADEASRHDLLRREAMLDSSAESVAQAQAALARHVAEGQRHREAMTATEAEGKRLATPLPAVDASISADVVARLRAAEAAITAPVPAYDGPATTSVGDAERALEVARSAVPPRDTSALEAASEALLHAQRKHGDARAQVAALESVSGQGHATCRHCNGDDPLGVVAALDEARQDVDTVARAEQAAARIHAEALAADEAATRARVAAEGRVRDAEGNLVQARAAAAALAGHADRIRGARERELATARAEHERETGRATERVAAHARVEAQRLVDLEAARRRWADAKAALTTWDGVGAPTVPVPPSAEERATLTRELVAVEDRLAARRAHAEHVERVRLAAAKYEAAKLTWDATRALVDAVRQARDDVASAAYSPIDRAARELLVGADAGGLPIPFFTSPSDYGAVVPGRGRVPYAGLSESEGRITAAALVFALATVAGCPCRLVMIDGLEVVQRDHRAALISALARAQQAGRVDSVVLTMASAPGEDLSDLERIEGLTIHRIERVASATGRAPAPLRLVANEGSNTEAAVPGACPF